MLKRIETFNERIRKHIYQLLHKLEKYNTDIH